jgi:transketolase
MKLGFSHQGVGGVLVSVGASYDDSASGRTHHAPGDVALVSTLPEWRVHVPGHPDEVERILRAEMAGEGCAYIRLSATSNARAVDVPPGEVAVVRRGRLGTAVVLAVGPLLDRVVEAARDVDATILYATTVRPLDGEMLRDVVDQADGVASIVVVEPYLEGTSAGEVSGALEGRAHRLLSIGVQPVELRRYGTVAEHDAAHGLDVAGIERRIRGFLAAVAAPPLIAHEEGEREDRGTEGE